MRLQDLQNLMFAAVAASAIAMADAQELVAGPRLARSTIELTPTEAQMLTLPQFTPEWWLAPEQVHDLRAMLASMSVAPVLAERLSRSVRVQPDGTGRMVPEIAWLDAFPPEQQARWWAILQQHRGNTTYRWPLAVPVAVLDRFALQAGFREVVRRVRRWSRAAGDHVLFHDVWAIEDAFASESDRREFFRSVFSTRAPLLKLPTGGTEADAATWAAYWHVNGRYRAIEPFYTAIMRIQDHDRIDLLHILPRFARSLLYTFPPDFGAARDLGAESGLVAAGFFATTPGDPVTMREGLSTWLRRECSAIAEAPCFGDVLVFEDPARTPWPYAAVYIADGFVLARQPTLFGAWRFLETGEIRRLNPRLAADPVTVFRRNSTQARAASAPHRIAGTPAEWRKPAQLRAGSAGPWGRLVTYDVLLAPARDILENLPATATEPEWPLFLPERELLLRTIGNVDMADETRRELLRVLREAPSTKAGLVTVRPPLDLVLQIPGSARAEIFRHLVPDTRSDAYAQTIKIASRMPAEQWFSPDTLPEPTRTAVIGLTYPAGHSFAISDYGALMHVLPREPEQRVRALRAVFREPALVVLLAKPAPAEIPALAAYWGGDQQADLTALLSSFAANESFHHLDIVHLLPPLAREYLNLYAFVEVGAPAASCYWTALNFDVPQPDPRLLTTPAQEGAEAAVAWNKLLSEYERIAAPGALGDIVAYHAVTGRDALVHVCSFIADDIVFTKNGLGLMAPWSLMRLDDVDALYLGESGVERVCFRRKPTSQ